MQTSFQRRHALAAAMVAFGVLAGAPAHAASWFGDTVKGNGNVRKEERKPGHFTAVSLSLPAQVEIRQGPVESVVVETDDNLMPLLQTAVEGETLKIRSAKRDVDLDSKTMRVIVTAPDINKLAVGGSGNITSAALKSKKLVLAIGGSGSIDIQQAEAESLEASISGSGDVKLGGSAKEFAVRIAGSGDVKAAQLKAGDASVKIAGSGDAILWATGALKASIAGSGDVKYWGDATTTVSVAGSGSVKRLGAAPQ